MSFFSSISREGKGEGGGKRGRKKIVMFLDFIQKNINLKVLEYHF